MTALHHPQEQKAADMKVLTITFDVRGYEAIEVPEDWEWDGTLDSLLEFTDLSYQGQELLDLKVS